MRAGLGESCRCRERRCCRGFHAEAPPVAGIGILVIDPWGDVVGNRCVAARADWTGAGEVEKLSYENRPYLT